MRAEIRRIAAIIKPLSIRERGARLRPSLRELTRFPGHFVYSAVLFLTKLDPDGCARVSKPRLAEDLALPLTAIPGLLSDLTAFGVIAIDAEGPEFVVLTLPPIARTPAEARVAEIRRPESAALH